MIKQFLCVFAISLLLGCSTPDETKRWPAGDGSPTITLDGVEVPIERPVKP